MENVERTEIQHMLERSDYVEKENRCLKDLLDRAGISYEQTGASKHTQEDIFDKDVALILEEAEEQKALVSLLKKLKVSYQEVLILQYYYDMSTKEIAEVLGKTEDNVRHLAKRAREKLRAIVEENGLWNEKKKDN